MYYKVLIVSIDNRSKIIRYFEALNSISLISRLQEYPGLDLKHIGYEIISIEPVSATEYKEQCIDGRSSYHLRTNVRFVVNEPCRLETQTMDDALHDFFPAEIMDYSVGGIKLSHRGLNLKGGKHLKVSIDSLNIARKEASVIWEKALSDGSTQAGLRWI